MYCDLYKWVVVFSDKVEYIHLYIYTCRRVNYKKKHKHNKKYHTHTTHTITVNDQLKGLFKEFTLKRRKEPLVCISVYSFSRNMCLLTSWLDLFCIFAETRIQGKKVSLLLAKLGDNNKKVHRFY